MPESKLDLQTSDRHRDLAKNGPFQDARVSETVVSLFRTIQAKALRSTIAVFECVSPDAQSRCSALSKFAPHFYPITRTPKTTAYIRLIGSHKTRE
jgi:hypothetical protein